MTLTRTSSFFGEGGILLVTVFLLVIVLLRAYEYACALAEVKDSRAVAFVANSYIAILLLVIKCLI